MLEVFSSGLEKEKNDREIGNEALTWMLSSAKPGHGVHELRDNDLTTFWQSDGSVPHSICIIFHRKQLISKIEFHSDYKLDESYTPQHIIIKAGTGLYEQQIVYEQELKQPQGWQTFILNTHKRQNKNELYLKTNKIIINIMSSHQNGRDTHVRQVKIYSPNNEYNNKYKYKTINFNKFNDCNTKQFLQYSNLR